MKIKILLVDGSSGCGKTSLLRMMGSCPRNTVTSEHLLDMIKGASVQKLSEQLADVRFVENFESFRGRPESQKVAARLVQSLAMKHRIVIAGIDLQELDFFLRELPTYCRIKMVAQ